MATERSPRKGSNLPRSRQSAHGRPADAAQVVILVIDDDTEVLDSVRRLLIREGWMVLTASNPLEGLELFEAYWREIQVVVLDFFMPILSGDKVFGRLQRIHPRVRVLLTTACENDIPQEMFQNGLRGFVQKPLSPRDLIDQIRQSLNHDRSPGAGGQKSRPR